MILREADIILVERFGLEPGVDVAREGKDGLALWLIPKTLVPAVIQLNQLVGHRHDSLELLLREIRCGGHQSFSFSGEARIC